MGLWRLVKLAQTPQGRKLIKQAQKMARDPETRERLAKVRARIEEKRSQRQGETPAQEGGGSQKSLSQPAAPE